MTATKITKLKCTKCGKEIGIKEGWITTGWYVYCSTKCIKGIKE